MMRRVLRPARWILRKWIYRQWAKKAEKWVESQIDNFWFSRCDTDEELVGNYTMEEIVEHIEEYKKTGVYVRLPWKSGKRLRAPPPPP